MKKTTIKNPHQIMPHKEQNLQKANRAGPPKKKSKMNLGNFVMELTLSVLHK